MLTEELQKSLQQLLVKQDRLVAAPIVGLVECVGRVGDERRRAAIDLVVARRHVEGLVNVAHQVDEHLERTSLEVVCLRPLDLGRECRELVDRARIANSVRQSKIESCIHGGGSE